MQRKSAAEFFTENQTIAGFDNPGKSLYTTIRSTWRTHWTRRSPSASRRTSRWRSGSSARRSWTRSGATCKSERVDETLFEGRGKADDKEKARLFYRVTCRDNGCGEPRGDPRRVRAGARRVYITARGRRGASSRLGAKMALIWGKKSSGLPLTVRTARAAHEPVTDVVLDIDIQRNEPRVLEDSVAENSQKWRGAELTVTVGGNWKANRARIVQYLRQLAIITPYASLRLDFRGSGGPAGRAPGVRAADDEGAPGARATNPAEIVRAAAGAAARRKTAQPSLGAFCRHALQGGPTARHAARAQGGRLRREDVERRSANGGRRRAVCGGSRACSGT